jgi:hypothetical protein
MKFYKIINIKMAENIILLEKSSFDSDNFVSALSSLNSDNYVTAPRHLLPNFQNTLIRDDWDENSQKFF